MQTLTDHPPLAAGATGRHPALLLPTPNGQKVDIALEELDLRYEAHRVLIRDGDQKTGEFLALSPNGRIPAMIDPNGPDGTHLALFESGRS